MRRVRASVVNLFYAAVILTAAFKALVFALTLYAENNIHKVEQLASNLFGTQVHIETITASWSGLLPKIWLGELSLGDEERLQLGDVRININQLSLPWWKTNPPLDIKLKGMHLHILRDESGKTRLVGMAGRRMAGTPKIPAHIHIENARILWEDNKHGGAKLQLEQVDIHLTSRGQQSHLVLNSVQHGLLIRADIQGDILGNDWSGQTYFRTDKVDARPFVMPYLPAKYTLSVLDAGLEYWGQWQNSRHIASQAKLELQRLELRHASGQRLTLDAASADLHFRRMADLWRLQISNFTVSSTKGKWPASDMLMELSTKEPGLQHLRVGISHIPVQALNRISVIFRPSGKLDDLLSQLSPTGNLHKIQTHLVAGASPKIQLRSFATDFSALSTRAWKKIPAASNFSGSIRGNASQFKLKFDSMDAALVFPKLFRWPLSLSRVNGQINWQTTPEGGWQLGSDELTVNSPDLKTVNRINILAQPEQSLFVDVQTDFSEGVGANAGIYYPVGIMSSNLVDWLDNAIVSGKVTRGSFLLQGPLQDFPYHETHTGHFEVLFDTEDLLLNYQQGWPPLDNIQGSVRFYANELQIEAKGADLLATKVGKTSLQIPSLKPGSAIHIQGRARGSLNDALRLLRETPLQDKFSSAVSGMQASGKADTRLKLSIPLSPTADYQFEGQLNMRNAGLKLTDHQLELSGINGRLNLDMNGISADRLQFDALGGHLLMDMTQSTHASTLIKLSGTLPIAQIQKQYPYLQIISASGAAQAQIQLDLPNNAKQKQSQAHLNIRSRLKGIALDMPAPLNKSANIPAELDVSLLLNTPQTDLRIKYADQLQLHIKQNKKSAYEVSGDIGQLPLNEWIDWYSQLANENNADDFELHRLKLNMGQLSLPPFISSDLQLNLRRNANDWQGKLASSQLQGNFTIPLNFSTRPVVIHLDKLSMHFPESQKDESPTPLPVDNLNPVDFPAIELSCKALFIDDNDMGQLEFKSHKTKQGIEIDSASLLGKTVKAKINGWWKRNGANASLTQLQGKLRTSNLGHLLENIYGSTPLSESKTKLKFDTQWAGAPFQYHPANVQGSMEVEVEKGRVLDVDPGAARMLGLLNIRTLNRRLRLDFSDLYKEGLSFDSIKGSFDLSDGRIYSNDLTVKSPSALIQYSGNADIVKKQFDWLISVSPKLDATLPVAGAIVGGPATGLAVLLAQQVMSKPLSKLQQIKYSVQGPWDDPVVTHIKRKKRKSETDDILNL